MVTHTMFKFVLAVLYAAMPASLPAQVDRDGPALSPFRGMRRVEAGIDVQVLDDVWHELESVAGVDTATLLLQARRLCGRDDWRRITEDLPALLDAMGHEVDGVHVEVIVRDLTTGRPRRFESVEMTGDNRQRVKTANREGGGQQLRVLGGVFDVKLSAAAVADDLACLRGLLDTCFAYRELRAIDLDRLFAAARRSLGDQRVGRRHLVQAVDHLLRQLGDGHSRLRESVRSVASTPFLVQQVEGGYAAFLPDRSAFVDPARPFLVAIDGLPLERWLQAADRLVTQGSSAMRGRERERLLRDIGRLREALGRPHDASLTVTLRGEAGAHDQVLAIAVDPPAYGTWPEAANRRLDGDLGYLRLAAMTSDSEELDAIDRAMSDFRDTRGLIVDVRGNGGGSRDALRRLAPYLLPDDRAIVGNVAALLLENDAEPSADALADRHLHRADWEGWNERHRAAIADFLKGFKPSWKLPPGRFSPWHFMVLDRGDNAAAFTYRQPVVVLVDRGCFSATDVFAAALQTLPSVTLVGEPTSGGSGRARRFRLPNSGIELQLSSMASFRPDGVLFEGNGVTPDVPVATVATDLLGSTDAVLAKAVELLQ